MKKVLATLFAATMLLAGSQAYAQVVVGVGYLHAIENTKDSDGKAVGEPDHMNGFYLGAGYNFHLGKHFGFTPGFYVDMLFQSMQMNDGASIARMGLIASASANYHYTEVALNIPLEFNFNIAVGDKVNFFAYAGPTIQYGVMARSTLSAAYTINGTGRSGGEAFNHYGKDGDGKPFNVLLGGGIGIGMGDIQFNVGYDHTLLNISKIDGYTVSRHYIKAGFSLCF